MTDTKTGVCRCRVLGAVDLAFAAGMFFGAWRAVRAPIDEHHAIRMETEEKLDQLENLE